MKQVLKLLVQKGADINLTDKKKRTPIHYMFVRTNRRQETSNYEPMNTGLDILINK